MPWYKKLGLFLERFFGSFAVLRPIIWSALIVLVIWVVLTTQGAASFLKSSDWLVRLLQVALWPTVVLLAILLIFTTRTGARLFSSLTGRVQKVSAFGVELDLTSQVASEVRYNVAEAFNDYRIRINSEFDRQVHIKRIDDYRRKLVEGYVKPSLSEAVVRDFRCTIHLQDVLFEDAMYQLLDYYPRAGSQGGRGRTFSIRRGILGKAWRSHKYQIEGKVPTDPKQLITDWAMTEEEATGAAQGRRSFACILIYEDEELPLGVLYLDSEQTDAFKDELAGVVKQQSDSCGLTVALRELGKEMREIGPAIKVFE